MNHVVLLNPSHLATRAAANRRFVFSVKSLLVISDVSCFLLLNGKYHSSAKTYKWNVDKHVVTHCVFFCAATARLPACRVRKLLFLNHPRSDVIKKDDDCLSSSYHPNFRVMDGEALVVAFANPRDDDSRLFFFRIRCRFSTQKWDGENWVSSRVFASAVVNEESIYFRLLYLFLISLVRLDIRRGAMGREGGFLVRITWKLFWFCFFSSCHIFSFFFSGLTKKRNKFSL